jgi:dCTP deaminase
MSSAAGILTGPEIRRQVELGRIVIDPFDERHVNPASVDLTLGDQVTMYNGTYALKRWPKFVDDGSLYRVENKDGRLVWDTRCAWPTTTATIDPEVGWVLKPELSYLLHTAERINTEHYVPIIDGKSSVGRAFIMVHYTAGYGDPGFDGQFTLEVSCRFPVRIFPGMRICQIRFHTMIGEPLNYRGSYEGASMGAVPSRLYKSGYDAPRAGSTPRPGVGVEADEGAPREVSEV